MEPTLFRLVLALKGKCSATEARIQQERSLTPAEFHGLLSLGNDSPVSAGDFAGKIGLSVSRASRVSGRLMNKGLLKIFHNPEDRRGVTLELTRKGIDLKKTIESDLARCEKSILSALTAAQRDQVARALQTLIRSM